MKKRKIRWKIFVPLVLGMLIMAVAFVVISYFSYREYEIGDSANYSRSLTKLIADEIVKPNDVEGFLQLGTAYPRYKETMFRLSRLREAYPDVVYLYAYRPEENGLRVVFDLDTDAFKGSLPAFMAAFSSSRRPSEEDIREIRKMLDEWQGSAE